MTPAAGKAAQIPSGEWEPALASMIDALREQGALPVPEWETVLRQVPRHLFAPAKAWAYPGSLGAPQEG